MVARRTARPEQVAVFEHAKVHNTVAIMPTNSGKTLIAAMLAHHYLSLPQHLDQIVLFLAPTVVLARQQSAALSRDLTGGTGSVQQSLYGGITHKIPKLDKSGEVECPEWVDSRSDLIRCFAGRTGTSDMALGLHWNDPQTWLDIFQDLEKFRDDLWRHFSNSESPPPPEIRLPWRRKWLAMLSEERAEVAKKGMEATEGVPDPVDDEDDVEVEDDPSEARLEAWPRIFVMTPDKLLNYLQHGLIQLANVSLLVVDECHHVEPGSPYGVIMNEFYAKACPLQQNFQHRPCLRRPRILGLTASPISEKINLKFQDTFSTKLVGENLAAKLKEICTVYNAYVHTGSTNAADPLAGSWSASRPIEQVVPYREYSLAPTWSKILRAAIFDPLDALLSNSWELPESDDQTQRFRWWWPSESDKRNNTSAASDQTMEGDILASERSMDALWWLLRSPLRSQKSKDRAEETLRIIRGYQRLILIFESISEVAASALADEDIDGGPEQTSKKDFEEVHNEEAARKLISDEVTRRERAIREALRKEAHHTRIVELVTKTLESLVRAFLSQPGGRGDWPRYTQSILNSRAAARHEWQQQRERAEGVLADMGFWGFHQVAALWYSPCMTALHAHSEEINAESILTVQGQLKLICHKSLLRLADLLKAPARKELSLRILDENEFVGEEELLRKVIIEENLTMLEAESAASLINDAVRLKAKSPPDTLNAEERFKSDHVISDLDPALEVYKKRSYSDNSVYFANLAKSDEKQIECACKILDLCKTITTARVASLRGLRQKNDAYIHQENLEVILCEAPRLTKKLKKLWLTAQRKFFLLLYEAFLSRHVPLVKAIVSVAHVAPSTILLKKNSWQEPVLSDRARRVVSDKLHQCEVAIRKVAWVKLVPEEAPTERINRLRELSKNEPVGMTSYILPDDMGRIKTQGLKSGRYRDDDRSEESSISGDANEERNDSADALLSDAIPEHEPGLLGLHDDSPLSQTSDSDTSIASESDRSSSIADSSSDSSAPRRRRRSFLGRKLVETSDSDTVSSQIVDTVQSRGPAKRFLIRSLHQRVPDSRKDAEEVKRGVDNLLGSRGLTARLWLSCSPEEIPDDAQYTLLSVPMKLLVFCCNRLTAQLLSLFIRRRLAARVTWVTGVSSKGDAQRELWRSRTPVRHHSVQTSIKAPTAAEQLERVKLFRKAPGDSPGIVQALVATSVVEEGFDLPECSAVVRFDLPDTLAQNVQSRGRAREMHSQYFLFVEATTQYGLTHLSTLAALEKLSLSLCRLFTCEAVTERDEAHPDDSLVLSELAHKRCKSDIWNERSGAFIPLGRAPEVLQYLLVMMGSRKDEDGLPIERYLRSWLCTHMVEGGHRQSPHWDNSVNLWVYIPRLLGNAHDFTPEKRFGLMEGVSIRNDQKRRIYALLCARALRFLHASGVLDDRFLPPPRSYGFYESFYRRTKKKGGDGGNRELLWREAPELLLHPLEYLGRPSTLHHSQEWSLLKLGNVPLDDADHLVLVPRASQIPLLDFMSIGIKLAAGQTMEDVKQADAAVSDLFKLQNAPETSLTEAAMRAVLPPLDETAAAAETPMYTLYPHQVWYKVSAWNSEILKSGGLYGFWRLHYNAEDPLSPPSHMTEFAAMAPEFTSSDFDAVAGADFSDEEDGGDAESDGEEFDAKQSAENVFTKTSTQFAIDAEARKIGSRLLAAMKQAEKDHPSNREADGECRCCFYPGIRLAPEADPLMVLQPQALLLRAPLPRPVESVFIHSSTREVVKIIIRPITVPQLAACEWASSTGSRQVELAIEQQSKRGLKASFSPEGEDLAEYTQPISYEVSGDLLKGLRRTTHEMKRVWTVYNFNSPANAILRNKNLTAIKESDNALSNLFPPYVCMAPLKADGVSIDVDYLLRALHLLAFTRSANVRDTYAACASQRIREAAPPTILEMFRACPDAVKALDPSLFKRNASDSRGEHSVTLKGANKESLSLTRFYCFHTKVRSNDGSAYISDALWSPRILETDCEELTSTAFEPAVALREFDEGRAQIRSERRLALVYMFTSNVRARCAQVFDKSYRGIKIASKMPSSLARCIALHTILRGAEEPVLRMTHEKAHNFHFFRLAGIDWEQTPSTYTPKGGTLTLNDIYSSTYSQDVAADNTFLIYGDKTRQGPRICLSDEYHPRSEDCHAPQFAICLPFSEAMMQQLSWSPALYWVLDTAAKHMECKLRLDLTFSRAVPRLRGRGDTLDAGDQGQHTMWRWSSNGVTLSAPIVADVSLDQEYVTAAFTSPSAISDREAQHGERVARMCLFDLLQGKAKANADDGDVLALLLSDSLPETFRALLQRLLERHGNSALERKLQMIIKPWLGWNLPSAHTLFKFFPRPALRVSHNQVLEFLGDAVLKYVAAVWAFFAFKEGDEGVLTSQADTLKRNASLRAGVRKYRLHPYLLSRPFATRSAGKSGQATLADLRAQLVSSKQQADLFEALLGAVYWSHYHRIDFWPTMSDHVPLSHIFALAGQSCLSSIGIDEYGALTAPYFLHPSWTGSSAGVFVASMFIEAYIMQPKVREVAPLLQIFATLRDVSAWDLLDTRNDQRIRVQQCMSPTMPSALKPFPDWEGNKKTIRHISFAPVSTEQRMISSYDIKEAWPSSVCWKSSRYPFQFVLDNADIEATMREYFPRDASVSIDFDSTIKGITEEWCLQRGLPPRASNQKFLRAWFRDCPAKSRLRPDVYRHLCSARIHTSARGEIYGLPNYERLEFLGDAALALLLTEWLTKEFPDSREGPLSYARAILQSNRFLCRVMLRKLLAPPPYVPEDDDINIAESRIRDIDTSETDIEPSSLLYHCLQGQARYRFTELDRLQASLKGTPPSGDFQACYDELAEEDVQRAKLSAAHGEKGAEPEGDSADEKLVSFNRYKFIADVYESMIGVMLFEFRFDLRAVWETIKVDFLASRETVAANVAGNEDFLRDEKARQRSEIIAKQKAEQRRLQSAERDRLKQAKELLR